jgi:uncharacterized membrane protein YadS
LELLHSVARAIFVGINEVSSVVLTAHAISAHATTTALLPQAQPKLCGFCSFTCFY